MSKTNSPLDAEPTFSKLKSALEDGATNATAARDFKTSEKSIRRFRLRHEIVPQAFQGGAYTEIKDDGTAAGSTGVQKILDDPDTMLRQRGLDPLDWTISGLRCNEYEGPNSSDAVANGGDAKIKYYQTRFNVVAKTPIVPEVQLIAPRTEGWRPLSPPRGRVAYAKQPQLVAVIGDQQAPFHDKDLHSCWIQWCRENQPQRIVNLGDTIDLPDISRHQLDPENNARINECLQSGYDITRDTRDATPDAIIDKLYGNHDERLRNLILDKPKNNALYGLKRPDTPEAKGEEVFELSHLMRLDELHVNLVKPHGSYQLGSIILSEKLAVRHGWLAQRGAGASALATLRHLGYSIIVGHTHRQSIVHESKHEITGKVRVLKGIEAGCMCRVEQTLGDDGRIWPSYTPAPDWQQGFCTVALHPNGFFQVDLATYVNGALIWRDQLYTA